MIGIFARGDRLGVALALAVILLLTTALATTISVIQTNDLSNKGVPVATHWSSPECANGFSRHVTWDADNFGLLYFGIECIASPDRQTKACLP
jgi:hypothetical protein